MKIKNKEKFIKWLFFFKHIKFINYETDLDDEDLKLVIDALNIRSRYKRIKFIIESGCDYIDNYYKNCNLCSFKNNKCKCHRQLNKDYLNGCCRKCIYQSNRGCTTKNVACKLFECSYVEHTNVKRINFKDILVFKLLNPYQRAILKTDYFGTLESVTIDLYVGPICLMIRLIYKFLIKRVIR